jgi:hypothetical protein
MLVSEKLKLIRKVTLQTDAICQVQRALILVDRFGAII